jgi:hypothetical protein
MLFNSVTPIGGASDEEHTGVDRVGNFGYYH